MSEPFFYDEQSVSQTDTVYPFPKSDDRGLSRIPWPSCGHLPRNLFSSRVSFTRKLSMASHIDTSNIFTFDNRTLFTSRRGSGNLKGFTTFRRPSNFDRPALPYEPTYVSVHRTRITVCWPLDGLCIPNLTKREGYFGRIWELVRKQNLILHRLTIYFKKLL